MKNFFKTPTQYGYLIKLLIRVLIFAGVFTLYLTHKDFLHYIFVTPIWKEFAPLHLLWIIFMVMMIRHLIPTNAKFISMASKKMHTDEYVKVLGYSELELSRFIHDQNIKAWTVMLIWLIINGIWGLLYVFGIVDDADLLMLSVFYFLADYICIIFFCPFQNFIMRNKCCVNCRIYDWGHFMMFTPMLFIQNFYSWSLFFTSCVVLIHWEIVYAKHPERFWSGSNQVLQCNYCRDKTCHIKERLHDVKR
ncbi:MAG: hypothetical protein GX663_09010 [Clostridiales bacterium]|nr:hypothetical protein [Clostridiales bacterium]